MQNDDTKLNDEDYCWLYMALGYMAGGWGKDNPHDAEKVLKITVNIKDKLEALQKGQNEVHP